MYIIIDNYDSFTYNLYQYMCELTDEVVTVFRNDEVSIDEIEALTPDGIIISPGPGRPEEAGVSTAVIKHFAGKVPILGVCLGHQAIGYAFGASIVRAKNIVHGKVESIRCDGKGVFRFLQKKSEFTRYHSLVIDKATLPDEFEISARSDDGEIMGIRHKKYIMEGVQFHPESMASVEGKRLLGNFINYTREPFDLASIYKKIMDKKNLDRDESSRFMEALTNGDLTNAQIAGVLVGLNVKGITPSEIAGCAQVLQRKRIKIETSGPVLDTCGTGGDGLGTFNISSFAALIAASCGIPVAKHGNKAVSSLSGSADFYNKLGIRIDITPDESQALLEKEGFAFLFAPIYHKAMRFAGPPRRELGIKTIMNMLGPLVNPAGASRQLIGVFDKSARELMARAAKMLGVARVMAVHARDGQDELSVCAPTDIIFMDENDNFEDFVFDPADIGIGPHCIEDLAGGNAADNVAIARAILTDNSQYPAVRDSVCLNAGAALYVYGETASIEQGYKRAVSALTSGKVNEKLERIISACEGLE